MKKLTIEYIKESFEKKDYKLLTSEYEGCEQKLDYICPKGHQHNISWSSWNRNHRCPYCFGNAKLTIEFIRSEFDKEGYKLLTTEYINCKQKLNYICPNGHKHNICWGNWSQKQRCPYCAGLGKPTIEFIRSEFEREGYILLSQEYQNAKQRLAYLCPESHENYINWDHWIHGKRCPICAIINNSGKNHYNWQGGVSAEPYCPIWINKEFRQMILERDNYQCQNPDCWGTSEKICGHHIDYNKKNCNPFNIITVCNSCNCRANLNREYWTKFYQEIMSKKYGYIYGK